MYKEFAASGLQPLATESPTYQTIADDIRHAENGFEKAYAVLELINTIKANRHELYDALAACSDETRAAIHAETIKAHPFTDTCTANGIYFCPNKFFNDIEQTKRKDLAAIGWAGAFSSIYDGPQGTSAFKAHFGPLRPLTQG